MTSEPALPSPMEVLVAFRKGRDTKELALFFGHPEHVIDRLLSSAFDLEDAARRQSREQQARAGR